ESQSYKKFPCRCFDRGHFYFARKGQSYFAQRGQSRVPEGVNHTRLFHAGAFVGSRLAFRGLIVKAMSVAAYKAMSEAA
ncbi:MAG: hypothetical protein J6J20_09360, partial [Muribaculaceae bacterium]|nr:hypothetical protein [Muribaculaceae bacterium]